MSPEPLLDETATEATPLLHTTPRLSHLRSLTLTVAAAILIFIHACNLSLLTTIQGAIARDLDAYEYTTWLTAAFLVPLSSIPPLAGRLCDVFSPRRCIAFGTLCFALGCLASSAARAAGAFIAGRVLTGVGAAFVMTALVVYVIRRVGTKKRGALLGGMSTAITIGTASGAIISGGVEERVGWRVLFYAQAPIMLAAGAVMFWAIPSESTTLPGQRVDKVVGKLKRIDYLGGLTLTGATVALLLALSFRRIEESLIVFSVYFFSVFILIEIYVAEHPIIPMSVLGSRGALLSCTAVLLYMTPRWALLFYTPVFAIAVRGWQPAMGGVLLLPTNFGFAVGSLLAGTLHIRRAGSFYFPSVLGYLFGAVILALIAYAASPTSSLVPFALLLFLHGLTSGASTNYSLVHILHLTPALTHSIVPSLHATFRGSAGSFGSAIGGGMFDRQLHAALRAGFVERGLKESEGLIRQLAGNPRLVWQLSGLEHDAAVEAYASAFGGLLVASVACCAGATLLQSLTGWQGVDAEPR